MVGTTDAPPARSRRAVRALLLLAATSSVAACSTPGSEVPAVATGGGGGTPLEEHLGAGYAFDQDTEISERLRQEELITQCMADEGFEYESRDVEAFVADWSPETTAERGTREWIVQNGYGVTTQPGGSEAVDPWADPNAEYLETLSPPSRMQFQDVLHGDESGLTDDGELSCLERSWKDDGAWSPDEDPALEAILSDLTTFRLEVAVETVNEPEMATANESWAGCMAEAGYPDLTLQPDAEASIADAYHQAQLDAGAGSPGSASDDDPFAMEAVTIPAGTLVELQQREVVTAVADLDCREETGFDDALLAEQTRREEQYIADNTAALDELAAAYEQQQ